MAAMWSWVRLHIKEQMQRYSIFYFIQYYKALSELFRFYLSIYNIQTWIHKSSKLSVWNSNISLHRECWI